MDGAHSEVPRDEREFSASIELQSPTSPFLPGLKTSLSFRRLWDRQAKDFAQQTAEAAGIGFEGLGDELSNNGAVAKLYATAGNKAAHGGDPYLNDILARLVASALLDPAMVDPVAYVVDRIVKLEPIHIRILALFMDPPLVGIVPEKRMQDDKQSPRSSLEFEDATKYAQIAGDDEQYRHAVDRANDLRGFSVYPDKIGNALKVDPRIVYSCLLELRSVGFLHSSGDERSFAVTGLALAASKMIHDTARRLREYGDDNSQAQPGVALAEPS